MAQLVSVIGVSHSPFLPNIFRRYPDVPENDRRSYESYRAMHDRLADAAPDVIIAVGTDHFNHFFLDNMPPWAIGKCPVATGPHPDEEAGFNLPSYRARVDVDLAKTLIREGFRKGVDFAFSDDLYIEHSINIPLSFIRPEMDLPIVPIYCNVLAPPLPPAQRFYDVGCAIADIVRELPANTRVSVVGSGHLAIDVGGPRMNSGSVDPEWDRKVVGLIREGDLAAVMEEAAFENLHRRGTVTPGFLSFVFLLGVAGGARPSYAEVEVSETHGSTPFLAWD